MNFSSSYTNRFRRLGGKKAQYIQGSHLSGYQTDPCGERIRLSAAKASTS